MIAERLVPSGFGAVASEAEVLRLAQVLAAHRGIDPAAAATAVRAIAQARGTGSAPLPWQQHPHSWQQHPLPWQQPPAPRTARTRPLVWVLAAVCGIAVLAAAVVVGVVVYRSGSSPAATRIAGKPATVSCMYVRPQPGEGPPAPRHASLPPASGVSSGGKVTVRIRTNQGELAMTLDRAKAPCTVNSFVALAKQKYFDDTPCHRLTTRGIYVLTCGDPGGIGTGGPGYSFPDENLPTGQVATYPAGTVAMANAGPDTNGSQFFLVYRGCQLPPVYQIFGTITGGLGLVTGIAAAGSSPPGDGRPLKPVTITSVTTTG